MKKQNKTVVEPKPKYYIYSDKEKMDALHVLNGMNNGNIKKTSDELGINRNTLRKWQKSYTTVEKSAEEIQASTRKLVEVNQNKIQTHYDSVIDRLAEADHMIIDMIMEHLKEIKNSKGKDKRKVPLQQLSQLLRQVGDRVKSIQARDDGSGVNLTQNNLVVNVFNQAEEELKRYGAM